MGIWTLPWHRSHTYHPGGRLGRGPGAVHSAKVAQLVEVICAARTQSAP